MWESMRIHVGCAKKIQNKRTELIVVGVPLAKKNVWKAAESGGSTAESGWE